MVGPATLVRPSLPVAVAVAIASCSVTPEIPAHAPSEGELNYCVAAVREGRMTEAITICSDCLSYDPDASLCHLGLAVSMLEVGAVAPNADAARDFRASARCHLEQCRSEPRCEILARRLDEDFHDLPLLFEGACGHRHPDFFAPLDICQSPNLPTIDLRKQCKQRRDQMTREREHDASRSIGAR